MKISDALKQSKKIREEATKFLNKIKITDKLSEYGQVNLIGSYTYDVMWARDIDFHVVIKKFDQKIVKSFFNYLVDKSLFEEIIFHDKHKFNKEAAQRYASKKALDSYYFGLRSNYNSNLWQIGVNFITQRQEASVEIDKLFEKATEKQRRIIVKYKILLREMGYGISSAYIYRAVLEKNIKSKEDLLAYLRSIGYKI